MCFGASEVDCCVFVAMLATRGKKLGREAIGIEGGRADFTAAGFLHKRLLKNKKKKKHKKKKKKRDLIPIRWQKLIQ